MTLLQGSVHFSTNEFNVFGFRNEPIGLFQKVMSNTNCDKIRIAKIGVPIFKGTSSKLSIFRTPDQDFRCFSLCEINRIHHWCSVGTEQSKPVDPPFQWETRFAKFPTEQWTRGLGFFWNH